MNHFNQPLISVLLCVYNDKQYVQKSVMSIISQTYENWELIIIDDGSQDGTYDLLKQIKDPRIKIYRQTNQGLTISLNIAARYAKGEFLARQDADDISMPNRFTRQMNLFKANPDMIVVGSDSEFIDEDGIVISDRQYARTKKQVISSLARLSAPFSHGSLMIKKTAFDQINGYDEAYPVSQDFDLILRMSQLDGEMASVPDVLYQWRIRSESISVQKWQLQLKQTLKFRKKIKQMYPNSMTFILFIKHLITKIWTGLSFYLFSPKSFYYYRLAALNFNQQNIQKAQKYFRVANLSGRLYLPDSFLPVISKILKLKRRHT
jgi:glycosyltransferase involved in cell wall biosynthesis